MKYIDDKVAGIASFDPTAINKSIADLKSGKANQSEFDNWTLGFGIGMGVL